MAVSERSMILSSSPRSSHTPRHCGQKSISTPCRSEIDSVTLQTGQSMPCPASAAELMIVSSRLSEDLSLQLGRNTLAVRCAWNAPPRTLYFRSGWRSEEHTSELQSLMRISYAVFCLKKNTNKQQTTTKQRIS